MKNESKSKTIIPVLFAVGAAALFGIATPMSKVLLRGVNPFLLAGLLYLGASAGLFPVLLSGKQKLFSFSINRRNLLRLAGAVTLGGVAGPLLLLSGLKYASASSVSLWLNFELVATAVLGFLFFRDYLGPKGWLGVVAALVSGVLLSINEGTAGFIAAALVCSACVCWGLDNHFTALIDGITALQSTFIKGLFAGTINTAAGLLLSGSSLSGVPVLSAAVLGSFSYGISIVLYIVSAQKLGAIRSQMIFSSSPFFGVLFSMIILAEPISPLQMVSLAILVIAIALMLNDRHDHFHEHEEMEHTHFHDHDDLHHCHDHEGDPSYHDHRHRHDKGAHVHPHWPDIHHRHGHH